MMYLVIFLIFCGIGLFLISVIKSNVNYASMKGNGINNTNPNDDINQLQSTSLDKFHTVKAVGSSVVVWSDMSSFEPYSFDNFELLNKMPSVGEVRVVWIFNTLEVLIGDSFWTFYQPGRSVEEGLLSHPSDLGRAGFVHCKIVDKIKGGEQGKWYSVEIVEMVPLSGVRNFLEVDRFDGLLSEELLQFVNCESRYGNEQWNLYASYRNRKFKYVKRPSGQWLLIDNGGEESRVILYGHWVDEYEVVYMTNIPISKKDIEYLDLQANTREVV